MRVVELKVVPSQDGAVERMTISVFAMRGSEQVVKESYDVIGGTPEAARTLMIEDTDRIVLDAQANHTIVYDKEQMSATPAPIDEAAAAAKKVKDEQMARQYDDMTQGAEEKRKADEEARGSPRRTTLGNVAEDQTRAEPSSPMGKAGRENQKESLQEKSPPTDSKHVKK